MVVDEGLDCGEKSDAAVKFAHLHHAPAYRPRVVASLHLSRSMLVANERDQTPKMDERRLQPCTHSSVATLTAADGSE